MNYYNVLLAKKTNRVLQFSSLYERLFETWINRARQILKDLPTGSISTVNDAAPLPFNALKVSVEAWQEGSDDPSPSNVRPIHGWDSGEIGVVGKNLAKYWKNGYINSSGQFVIDVYNATTYPIMLKTGETYTLRMNSETVASFNGAFFENFDGTNLTGFIKRLKEPTDTTREFTFTAESNSYFVCSGNVNMITPTEENFTTLWKIQLELGSIATEYTPYNPNGKQYTQQFPTTIYGAEWDVVGGELKQTEGYIASYNGETLPSTWISDRDVYASGTTPTTGAEVVYKLATPTTIPQQPLSIRLLEGSNNVYADCGEILSGKYWAEV